jgi:PAS domain S-box-containing protein
MRGKILIVDDEKDILEVLQAVLESEGYTVGVTTVSTSVISLLEREQSSEGGPYSVVLTDIMMPSLNGLELLHQIKQKFPEEVVIMLTAYMSVENAVKSLNEGAFAYLTKPIEMTDLINTMRNAFDKIMLSRENKRLLEELNRAKEYSEAIIEDLIYTVIATDTDGNIKRMNRAMEKVLGYHEEDITGRPFTELFVESFRGGSWQELINEGRVKDFPIAFLHKSGKELKLQFTGTVMKNSKGRMIGFLGTVRK